MANLDWKALAALAVLGAASVCVAQQDEAVAKPAVQERPPNVLIYMVDTLRADQLGCYGAKVTKTPRIDQFAEHATLFEQAHSTATATRPSVASLLTGVSPRVHGAENLQTVLSDKNEALVRLPELLKKRGYHTMAIVANPNASTIFGFRRGFAQFFELFHGKNYTLKHPPTSRSLISDAPIVVAEVKERIEAAPKDRPWFLYVLSIDPHDPYDAPEPYGSMYVKPSQPPGTDVRTPAQRLAHINKQRRERSLALYRGEVSYADHHFGELLDWLQAGGHLDNTAVVFTADHGEEFFDHGQWGHGQSCYEELAHVPMIIRFPHQPPTGVRRGDDVDMLDLSTTVARWGGAEPPVFWVGRDLGKPLTPRPICISQRQPSTIASAVIVDGYKLIRDERAGQTEFFHLPTDPGELHPLEGERLEKARKLLLEPYKQFISVTAALRKRLRDENATVNLDELPSDVLESLRALGYVD
jgi:arylsulfatase A-like enzyme